MAKNKRQTKYQYRLTVGLTAAQYAVIVDEARRREIDMSDVVRAFIAAGLLAQEKPMETAREGEDAR